MLLLTIVRTGRVSQPRNWTILKLLSVNYSPILTREEVLHCWLPVVGGDFNVGGIDWDALTTKANAKNKGTCKHMLDIITDGGLSQLQK